MTFSPNTPPNVFDAISQIIRIPKVDKFERYLGLPSVIEKSKKEVFSFFKEKLWDWKESVICGVGGIKSVLQSITNYIMSCFLLPKTIIQ